MAEQIYPYDWYANKTDNDNCPNCGLRPRDYYVQITHMGIKPQISFSCSNGHKWQVGQENNRVTSSSAMFNFEQYKGNDSRP